MDDKPEGEFDGFLEEILRRSLEEFGFITSQYPLDYPSALFWALAAALVAERGLRLRHAAEIVYDFCARRGDEIPQILHSGRNPSPIRIWLARPSDEERRFDD